MPGTICYTLRSVSGVVQLTNFIHVTLTNHAYHRAVERLGFQGSIEELAETPNEKCSEGYDIREHRCLYFADSNIVFGITKDIERNVYIAKTVLKNIFHKLEKERHVKVKWEVVA